MEQIRPVVVRVVIGSFSLAALMGIAVLLGAGGFGETEGRILATTVIVGIESLAVLCYLAVSGRSAESVGAAGAVVSTVPFGIALALTWADNVGGDALWQTFGVTLTVAASLAQVSLLLSRDHRQPWLLTGTLAAISVVALMIIGPILHVGGDDDLYWRLFGVVAILDALGTIALIALSLFSGSAASAPSPSEPPVLSDAVTSRLVDAARRRSTSPSELLGQMLDRLEP